MVVILSLFLHIFSLAYAAPDAAKLVPEGKVLSQKDDEIKVKTKAGTLVEIGVDYVQGWAVARSTPRGCSSTL